MNVLDRPSPPAQDEDAFSEAPLVGIVIVNWNRREDTLACLSSLQKTSYRPCKIILVDNASHDGSVPAIRRSFPQVEIIENAENRRFAAANNQGMERALTAGADFVLLLNNDTEVAEDFLEKLVRGARERSEIGMAGPKILYHDDPHRIWFAGGEITFWKGQIAHLGLRQPDGERWNVPRAVDYITGCALLVKRECIEKIGGFDESYYIYGEDADWCMRARRAGFQCWFVPAAHVWHKISASSGGGLTPFKAYHKVRSSFLFFRRYARWWHWLTLPWWVGLGLLRETIRRALRSGQDGRTVTALWLGFLDTIRRKDISRANGGARRRWSRPARPGPGTRSS